MTNDALEHLDEICARGRVFYERFPGTAVSDQWRAAFIHAHPAHAINHDTAEATPGPAAVCAAFPGESREVTRAAAYKR